MARTAAGRRGFESSVFSEGTQALSPAIKATEMFESCVISEGDLSVFWGTV